MERGIGLRDLGRVLAVIPGAARRLGAAWGRLSAAFRGIKPFGRKARNDAVPDVLVPARLRRDGMVVVGRRGRLFLAKDGSGTLEQHIGKRLLSDEELVAWHDQLEARHERLAADGRPYVMTIAPNAHAVYPEDLPEGVVTAPNRPVKQLLDYMSRRNATTTVLYPLDEILAQKQRGEVYPRTDSHWNEFGALAAYRRLAKELDGLVPMRVMGEDDFLFVSGRTRGDLGYKRLFNRGSLLVAAIARHSAVRLLEDNEIENTGRRLVTECRVAPECSCLVFGDSYAFGMLPFLAESFGRLTLLFHPAVDWDIVEEAQPDVVLTVMSERFLNSRREDQPGSFTETMQSKIAEGRYFMRYLRWEHGPHHVAPVAIEAMLAMLRRSGRLGDATLISTIAYGGLWPQELNRLRWRHVEEDSIKVLGPQSREVRMLPALAEDLAQWREHGDHKEGRDLVFPPRSGSERKPGEWREWVQETYRPLADEMGLAVLEPTPLRNTLIALLIQEGATLDELLSQVGGGRRGVRATWGQHIEAAERAGYLSAAAQVTSARRYADSMARSSGDPSGGTRSG